MVTSCVLFILLLIVYLLREAFDFIMRSPRSKLIYKKIKAYLFWNSTLRFIMEGYISMSLYSLTLANEGFNWSDQLDRAQGVFAIIVIIICGVAPIAMTTFFSSRTNLF
jgi:hypothetical protein